MVELIGKKIRRIFISDDAINIKFVTDQGDFIYHTDGDCCSETWIQEINHYDNLIDHVVNFSKELTEVSLPGSKQDEDVAYGIEFGEDKFCKGSIVYRNSSNGYYGGSIFLVGGEREWYKIDTEKIIWKEVTKDTW